MNQFGKWLLRGLMAITLLIAAEQSFLHFYLDNAAIHDEAAFDAYLQSLKTIPPTLKRTYPWGCHYARIALIYTFKMCVGDGSLGDLVQSRGYYLEVQKPAGYLTLVPWNDPDRIVYDGASVHNLDDNLKINDRTDFIVEEIKPGDSHGK